MTDMNTGGGQLPPVTLDRSRYQITRPETGGGVTLHIKESVDVAAAVGAAEKRREKEQILGLRKDAEIVPVARIPITVMRVIARRYGIDPINCLGRADWSPPTQAELRKLERIIERETPKLKTTNKRFDLKPGFTRSVS